MSMIAVFNGQYCNEKAIIEEIIIRTGFAMIDEGALASEAAKLSNMSQSRMERAFSAKASVFNKFTHERECAVAYLKLALAKRLEADKLLIWGRATHLIPRKINHVLRVCLIADTPFRISKALEEGIANENEAAKLRPVSI